jgi:malonyl-CoA decarboxylase
MNDKTGFLDRTLLKVRRAWGGIAGSAFDAATASLHPDLPEKAAESLYEQMRACLEPRGGEVSARARAAALGQAYLVLNGTGRERFLKVLAERFDVDHDAVDAAAENLGRARGMDARRLAEQALAKALEAPRVRLLTQFNALPDGVKFLVDLRAELIPQARRDPALGAMEGEIKALLTTWFDVDFLELRRITWDTASAALLEKLIAYEAVHAIESWDDLKNRLDSDRRCFAYFHPRMPDEPLIFVEVALVNGMAGNVQALLDEDAPVQDSGTADTAIFYSISNAQKGLAGISFGNFLIKRVVDSLASEFKGLKTFATLSPVPGFGSWLDGALASGDKGLLKSGERKALLAATGRSKGAKGALKELLSHPGWPQDEAVAKALRAPLMRLSARYLITERAKGERVKDRVAHFHLSNGARMDRINWLADTSARGLARSAGIMVNYVYDPGQIDDNHESYTSSGKVAASSSVRGLL